MTNLMSQFKTTTQSLKPHPHSGLQNKNVGIQTTTTQNIPQFFSNTFTKNGFMKFSRPK